MRLIGFEELTSNHIGEAMADIIQQVLGNIGIEDQLVAITSDNAANNQTMMRSLKLPHMDPIQSRIWCFAYIINLCIQGFLQSLKATIDQDTLQKAWEDEVLFPKIQAMPAGFAKTLAKVRYQFVMLFICPTIIGTSWLSR